MSNSLVVNAAIAQLIKVPVTEEALAYITWKAGNVIQCNPPPPEVLNPALATKMRHQVALPTPPSTPTTISAPVINSTSSQQTLSAMTSVPPLNKFIDHLVRRSNVKTGTLLTTVIYLDRLHRRLPKVAKGMYCTCHRVFLATLIMTDKYLNDSSPKNKHWARCSSVFSLPEVNLMEKQLLFLLDWDLRITEDELAQHFAVFLGGSGLRHRSLSTTSLPFINPTSASQASAKPPTRRSQSAHQLQLSPVHPSSGQRVGPMPNENFRVETVPRIHTPPKARRPTISKSQSARDLTSAEYQTHDGVVNARDLPPQAPSYIATAKATPSNCMAKVDSRREIVPGRPLSDLEFVDAYARQAMDNFRIEDTYPDDVAMDSYADDEDDSDDDQQPPSQGSMSALDINQPDMYPTEDEPHDYGSSPEQELEPMANMSSDVIDYMSIVSDSAQPPKLKSSYGTRSNLASDASQRNSYLRSSTRPMPVYSYSSSSYSSSPSQAITPPQLTQTLAAVQATATIDLELKGSTKTFEQAAYYYYHGIDSSPGNFQAVENIEKGDKLTTYLTVEAGSRANARERQIL